MSTYFANHIGPTAVTAILPDAHRRVRIRRLLLTTSASGAVRFKRNPGPSEVFILPDLHLRAGGPALDVSFDEEFPQTQRNDALGYTTDIAGAHSVWMEYELVA